MMVYLDALHDIQDEYADRIDELQKNSITPELRAEIGECGKCLCSGHICDEHRDELTKQLGLI